LPVARDLIRLDNILKAIQGVENQIDRYHLGKTAKRGAAASKAFDVASLLSAD
jgi:hypothetical protein